VGSPAGRGLVSVAVEADPRPPRASQPFANELPQLLAARGVSLRELARRVDVDIAHLSRVARLERDREVTGELAGRVAVALGLPGDFFIETRRRRVLEAVRTDVRLLDRWYDELETG
jgi:transcriptional regulator with XRE-family HTH domain